MECVFREVIGYFIEEPLRCWVTFESDQQYFKIKLRYTERGARCHVLFCNSRVRPRPSIAVQYFGLIIYDVPELYTINKIYDTSEKDGHEMVSLSILHPYATPKRHHE